MGRRPTISRESLLTLAEDIVNAEGPQALTIDALARAGGISKGGVQYSFASKDALIKGLVDRWTAQFDTLVEDIASVGPTAFVRSYIAAMRSSHAAINAKMAGLMIAYMQNPSHRRDTADWYRTILDRMDATADSRAARTAFMAVEGLMMLRIWGADDGVDWPSQLDDIEALLPADPAP